MKRDANVKGWAGERGYILFSELYRFEPPLLIKETVLGSLKARGRCWHGYPLTDRQAHEILEAANNLCEIRKV